MSSATVVTIFHATNDSSAFVDWVDDLRASAPNATELQVSVLGEPNLDWGVAARFPDEQALHHWLDSPARQRVLEDGRQRGILCATADLLISDDGGVPQGVGVFRHTVVPGREAEFVAAEARFLGPVLNHAGAPPWLAMWLSQVVSVAALQWVLMPWAGRRFRLWLDPVDGAGTRISAVGAAVLAAGYALTLVLFAAVQWLQYWDYARL